MSNIQIDFALFDVVDYKNEAVLSSYSLSITPLTFKARIPNRNSEQSLNINTTEATFDFGDGTFGHHLTSTHAYEYPGQYNVKLILRDCNNNAVLASYSTDVTIEDYIDNTFTIGTASPFKERGGCDTNSDNFELCPGAFQCIIINSQTPFYQQFQDIFFSLSGIDVLNYFNLNENKFNYLKKYYTFAEKNWLPNLSAYEYVELKRISLSAENIYVRLSSFDSTLSANTIVKCASSHGSSVLAGSSGTKLIWFKTEDQDSTGSHVSSFNVSLFKDRSNIFSRGQNKYKNQNFLNNLTVTFSADLAVPFIGNLYTGHGKCTFAGAPLNGNSLSAIEITSNGMGTQSTDDVSSFKINPIQYKGLGIPFILSPKAWNGAVAKSLSAGNPIFEVLSGGLSGTSVNAQYYTISSLNDTLSTVTDTNFWYRGVLTFNDNLSSSSTFIALSTKCQYCGSPSSLQTTLSTLTGSAAFTCYPKDYYSLYKQNEDFDFESTIKDLRFQEILLDKNIFFSDFIGSVFGNLSSNYEVLGKKLYENIFNFVANNNDLDYCDTNTLLNLADMVNEEGLVYDRTRLLQPNLIKRIVGILSTKYNKFRGAKNKFDENYNPKGHTTKITYGKNLGSELDTITYVVTAGTDIVAYEKFSGTFTRLNTFQPLSALSAGPTGTYKLSNYSTDVTNPGISGGAAWGWPLVLPTTYDITTVNKFYNFYSLSAAYDNTIMGSLIDFTNPLNTLSFDTPLSSLEGDDKIYDILIRNTLFSSLSLF